MHNIQDLLNDWWNFVNVFIECYSIEIYDLESLIFTMMFVQLCWWFAVQQPRKRLWIPVIVLSGLVIVAEASVVISWFLLGDIGPVLENEWFKLLGLARYVYHIYT
jgi:hypothetical protein